MPEFSQDELRRIQKNLRHRFHDLDPDNVIDLGVGAAIKSNRFDNARRKAICFYVQQKRRRPPKARRIPPSVSFKIQRGGQRPTFELPTDVIAVGNIRVSGSQVQCRGRKFVIGCRVGWQVRADRQDQNAWLTVGHPIPTGKGRAASGLEIESDDEIISGPVSVLAKSRSGSSFDSALLAPEGFSRASALRMHRVTGENLDIASLDSLRASVGQIGYLLRPKRKTRIRIQSLLPSLRIPELGTIVNVLAALGPVGTFAHGTSGSIWAIDDDPAGLQIAASTTGYRLGFSQAITSTLVWAETALQNHHPAGIHPESFKLIEIF